MRKPVPPLETADAGRLAHELRVLLGQMRRRLREETGSSGFSPSQLAVLGRLERDGPATVTDLACAEGVRPQSMGATVAHLESVGFLTGRADPGDGRRTLLSLTAACRQWAKKTRAAREDWLLRAIHLHLTASEQSTLAAAVELLKRLMAS